MTLPATDAVERRSATASELLYLVGTDLVPVEQLPDGPARQLATEYRSGRLRLAPHLAAVALWSLQRQGVASLELRRSKSLGFISRTELVVGLNQPGGTQPGIEGQLLSTLARKQPRDVGGLVRDWFGRPSSDVDGVVIQRVLEGFAQTALVSIVREDAGRGAVMGMLRGREKTVVTADHAAISAAADEIGRLTADWMAFSQSQYELASELTKRSQKALDSRKPVDSDGGDFGGDDD